MKGFWIRFLTYADAATIVTVCIIAAVGLVAASIVISETPILPWVCGGGAVALFLYGLIRTVRTAVRTAVRAWTP